MRIYAAYSHKGGTGKTTALVLLANAIAARGHTALLLDADPQRNFRMWRNYGRQMEIWDDKITVEYRDYETTPVIELEDFLVDANDSGKYDYALLNLPGIPHRFNQHALRYAELTLLPFRPTPAELAEMGPALKAIEKLSEDGEVGAARVLFTMIKAESKIPEVWRDYMNEARQRFPCMDTIIRDSTIFSDILMRGMLHLSIQRTSGLGKYEASRALEVCEALLNECEAIVAHHEEENA